MTTSSESDAPDNHVFLRGRLAAEPVYRELPSGDSLVVFRLTVPRPPGDRVRVDSIECVSVQRRIHRTLSRLQPGAELEVRGQLHRRFWRTATGPASRYAVDLIAARAVKSVKSGRRGAESRGRTRASA